MHNDENNVCAESLGAIISDRDIRDYRIAASDVANASLTFPDRFELEMPPVKNQGTVGSCVAHALAETIEFFNAKSGLQEDMSVGYIYGNRRNTDHMGYGMITRDAIKAVCSDGDVPHYMFPFNEEVPDIVSRFNAADTTLSEVARGMRPTSYFKVASANEIKTALCNGNPVIFAVTWYSDAKVIDGVITTNRSDPRGGHCMVIYGWDERGWKIQNSWGKHWGEGGRAILPYNYTIREAYCVIDDTKNNLLIIRPFHTKNQIIKCLAKALNVVMRLIDRIVRAVTGRK